MLLISTCSKAIGQTGEFAMEQGSSNSGQGRERQMSSLLQYWAAFPEIIKCGLWHTDINAADSTSGITLTCWTDVWQLYEDCDCSKAQTEEQTSIF